LGNPQKDVALSLLSVILNFAFYPPKITPTKNHPFPKAAEIFHATQASSTVPDHIVFGP
jgi:hypothetical protein